MRDIGEMLFEKYGARLTTADLGEVLHKSPDVVRNEISAETFPIPTYKDTDAQRSPWYADLRDVVEYLNRKRPKVEKPDAQGPDGYNVSASANRNDRRLRQPRVRRTRAQTVATPLRVEGRGNVTP